MNQLIETVVLGVIQGLTEWLPISSTGHLKIAEKFLGLKAPLLFDVILHLGTLTVILLFFRSDIEKILSALAHRNFKTDYGRLIPLIIVGTIPTSIIGLAFSMFLEKFFQEMLTVAVALLACGFVLYSAKAGKEKKSNISYSAALIIGIAQGIAVIPGLSRSGLTIATALLLGIKKDEAFKFSFLLSVPAVIGAFGLTFYTNFGELASSNLGWIEISAGVTAAMIVGYLALKLLWKVLTKRRFHVFAFYCWALGTLLVIGLILGVF
ncbi:MAG: undecaprenyl-diphosphate phosphatase [Candidatus Bathyarchaeales archaeon]